MLTRQKTGGLQRFVYAGLDNDIVAITDQAGTVQASYGRDPFGDLVSVKEGANPAAGAMTDLHQDLVGTFTGTALSSTTTYNPFGEVTAQTGTKPALGYQSEYTDPDTGNVNMHARWYQPGTGAFASRDTWTLTPDPSIQANRYTYGNGGPLTRIDPSGHVNYRDDGGGGTSTTMMLAARALSRAGTARAAGGTSGAAATAERAAAAVAKAAQAARAARAAEEARREAERARNRAQAYKRQPEPTPVKWPKKGLSGDDRRDPRPTRRPEPKRPDAQPPKQPQGRPACAPNCGPRGGPPEVKPSRPPKAQEKVSGSVRGSAYLPSPKHPCPLAPGAPCANPNRIELGDPDVTDINDHGVSPDDGDTGPIIRCDEGLNFSGQCVDGAGVVDPDGSAGVPVGDPPPPNIYSCDEAPNSFISGTRVLMADGSTKVIEDVKIGDRVIATDPATGQTKAEPVTALITGEGTKRLVKITVDIDGNRGTTTDTITATDNHPFWVPALRKWLEAGQLQPGMWLRTSAGTYVQVAAVKAWTALQLVHNLTVDELHTYHVMAGDQAILVHNDGWNPFKKKSGSNEPSQPEPNATIRDLLRYGRPDVDGSKTSRDKMAEISRMQDWQLMDSVFKPHRGAVDYIRVGPDGENLENGNHRAQELLNRAADPHDDDWDYDTPIYIDRHSGC
ncbi:polymorphic toxin-type HINT domain-containing protein [Nonomuraea angiospora]|uniref:polymorphic toxin-type HINT domain-containing protein n=1 Tax=Nonomuraea angiospora TaxID=46172 RepID=UPI003440B71C